MHLFDPPFSLASPAALKLYLTYVLAQHPSHNFAKEHLVRAVVDAGQGTESERG